MPRPSLTEEIEQLAYGLANAMVAATIADQTHRPHSYWQTVVQRNRTLLMDRLTALETELEGYRQAETGPLFVGTPARQGWTGGTLDASDAYVMTLNTSLPCESEYVNAQSGYDGENGG